MPVIKPTESLGISPAIIALFGEPGVRKTSIGNTFENPLLIDFDRGAKRSWGRKDVLTINSWDEVLQEENAGTFKGYSTIVIDTAKAALDDFLMVYVAKQDYKLATNKLKAYGAIGDAFKLFINNCRANGTDIVILAHVKKDEDTKRLMPDVTGSSYQLILRIADQVGYVHTVNNVPTITFNPTDTIVGKNVAGLDAVTIPHKDDPSWKSFGATLMESVKSAINALSEEQRAAMEQMAKHQEQIDSAKTPEEFTEGLATINQLPDHLKLPLKRAMADKAKAEGWQFNKEAGKFEKDPAKFQATTGTASEPTADAATAQQPAQESTAAAASTDTPPATPPAAAKTPKQRAKPGPKPKVKEEPTAQAQVAELQKHPVEWFKARIGKEVWMQAPADTADPAAFTGIYLIEDENYPDWLHDTLQNEQGYMFREATPQELAAAKEVANA